MPEGEGRGNCGGTEGVSDDINILEQVYLELKLRFSYIRMELILNQKR